MAESGGLSMWVRPNSEDLAALADLSDQGALTVPVAAAFPLAEAATELHAAHLMGLNAAMLLDRGDKALKELSMAKSYSVQAGFRALDRAIQTHGGMGLTNELGLVQAWQDLRIVNIADGTNEILARMISQRLLAGDLDL